MGGGKSIVNSIVRVTSQRRRVSDDCKVSTRVPLLLKIRLWVLLLLLLRLLLSSLWGGYTTMMTFSNCVLSELGVWLGFFPPDKGKGQVSSLLTPCSTP